MMDRQQMKILRAFHEATQGARGGEVVVRSGENTSRVFFVGGRIAWVTASSVKRTFTDYLIANSKLEREEVQEVFDECRRSGANFGETIIEWGLLSEPELRRLLLEHLTDCLLEVFCWDPVESMFVPEERTYKGSLTFELEELLQNVLERDQDGRLPFAGHAVADILEQLRTDREPTMPFLPAFSEQDVEPAKEHQSLEAPSDSVLVSEELRASARVEDAIPTDPPPVDDEPPPPPPPRSRTPWMVAAALLLAVGAGLLWLWAGGGEKTASNVVENPGDAGVASGQPLPVTDSGPAGSDAGILAGRDAGVFHQGGDDAGVATGGDTAVAAGAGGDGGATAADGDADGASEKTAEVEKPGSIIAGAAGAGTATLRVVSRPRRALIFLDGLYTGKKSPCTLEVAAGRVHSVMAVKKGRRSRFKIVTLQAGRKTTVNLKLHRGRDKRIYLPVHFESVPAGARVVLSGRRIKEPAPFPWKLRYDRITKVQMSKKRHQTWTGFVKPVPGKVVTIRATLE